MAWPRSLADGSAHAHVWPLVPHADLDASPKLTLPCVSCRHQASPRPAPYPQWRSSTTHLPTAASKFSSQRTAGTAGRPLRCSVHGRTLSPATSLAAMHSSRSAASPFRSTLTPPRSRRVATSRSPKAPGTQRAAATCWDHAVAVSRPPPPSRAAVLDHGVHPPPTPEAEAVAVPLTGRGAVCTAIHLLLLTRRRRGVGMYVHFVRRLAVVAAQAQHDRHDTTTTTAA